MKNCQEKREKNIWMKKEKIFNFIIALFSIVVTVLLVITIYLIMNTQNTLETYSNGTGRIVGFYEKKDMYDEEEINTYPIISYVVDGKSYEFEASYYSSTMQMGQEIPLMYAKENHSDVIIKGGLYIAPIITGSLTLVFCIVVIVFVILKKTGTLASEDEFAREYLNRTDDKYLFNEYHE